VIGWPTPTTTTNNNNQVTNEKFTRHAFDGDGMVCSFSFREGRVWFKNKFVRTKGFVDEQVRLWVACGGSLNGIRSSAGVVVAVF